MLSHYTMKLSKQIFSLVHMVFAVEIWVAEIVPKIRLASKNCCVKCSWQNCSISDATVGLIRAHVIYFACIEQRLRISHYTVLYF